MSVEIVTKEDLQLFRIQIVNDIKNVLQQFNLPSGESVEGYKTKHVRKILGCSYNKLVSLRVNQTIRWKKVGGTIYYNKEDVKKLMVEGY